MDEVLKGQSNNRTIGISKTVKGIDMKLPKEKVLRAIRSIKIITNILLFAILLLLVFVVAIINRDWLYPDRYSDNAQGVIIAFSFFVFLISIILVMINRKKWVWIALLLPDLLTLYKFLDVVYTVLLYKL